MTFPPFKYQKGVRNQVSFNTLILWHLRSTYDKDRSHRGYYQDACCSREFTIRIGSWKLFLHTGYFPHPHLSRHEWTMHMSKHLHEFGKN